MKQYCNKFNKDLKKIKGPHQNILKKKSEDHRKAACP